MPNAKAKETPYSSKALVERTRVGMPKHRTGVRGNREGRGGGRGLLRVRRHGNVGENSNCVFGRSPVGEMPGLALTSEIFKLCLFFLECPNVVKVGDGVGVEDNGVVDVGSYAVEALRTSLIAVLSEPPERGRSAWGMTSHSNGR